jgi:hypothetical protein
VYSSAVLQALVEAEPTGKRTLAPPRHAPVTAARAGAAKRHVAAMAALVRRKLRALLTAQPSALNTACVRRYVIQLMNLAGAVGPRLPWPSCTLA